MPIYPYHCQKCNELWDEIISYDDKPDACPACGEKKELKRMIGIPQRPKIQGSNTQQTWGYNKTTTEYLFDGAGTRVAHQYDENKRNAQKKEFIDKQLRKGSTVSVTKPKSSQKSKK